MGREYQENTYNIKKNFNIKEKKEINNLIGITTLNKKNHMFTGHYQKTKFRVIFRKWHTTIESSFSWKASHVQKLTNQVWIICVEKKVQDLPRTDQKMQNHIQSLHMSTTQNIHDSYR